MKNIKKILFVLLFLMLISVPTIVHAFSIQSYIAKTNIKPEIQGYYKVNKLDDGNHYCFNNTSPQENKYGIYRNSAVLGEEKYDVIVYPFHVTQDAELSRADDSYTGPYGIGFYKSSKNSPGFGGYKIFVTKHQDEGIGESVEWTGMMGFSDLDNGEYCIFPDKINTSNKTSHIGKNIEETLTDKGYKYAGKVKSPNDNTKYIYDYNSVYTQVTIGTDGFIVYYGSTGAKWGTHIAFDALKQYIELTDPTCDVTYIDVVDSVDGMELGRTTQEIDKGSTARGFDIGADTSDNAYYNGYGLVSDTSAVIDSEGICVYRIFKRCTFDIPIKVIWEDGNNVLAARTHEIMIALFNGNVSEDVCTISSFGDNTSGEWDYVFEKVPKYSTEDGSEIQYSIIEGIDSSSGFLADYVPSLRKEVKYRVIEYSGDNTLLIVKNRAENEPASDAKYGVTINGTVTWKDEADKYGFRPEVTVVSVKDQYGNIVAEKEMTAEDQSFTFTGLPYFNEDTFEIYKYTVTEKDINNYEISYDITSETKESTDAAGTKITWAEYNADFINVFKPDNETVRLSGNKIIFSADYFNKDGNPATAADFKAAKLVKENQTVNVTLKQLNFNWKPVDAVNGVYEEIYEGYSGNEIKLELFGTKKETVTDLLYGKYEIEADAGSVLTFMNMTEIYNKNVIFTHENDKYYVTYPYSSNNMEEEIKINLQLPDRFYEYKKSINNIFKK